MNKLITITLLTASLTLAATDPQTITLPGSTLIHVRLEQSISSDNEEKGQIIEFRVIEPIIENGVTLIAQDASVIGTITEAQGKRRMGRAGKLGFTIDRVRGVDGQWISLTYRPHTSNGGSHAIATGVAVGVTAVVFWPAAPVFLLIQGKDKTINRGVTFETFTESDHVITLMPVVAAQTTSQRVVAPAVTSGLTVINSSPGTHSQSF